MAMKKLTVFGFVASFTWIAFFAVILWLKADAAADLDLNEWGDFLAGATAPLALMWIVIGYFLQGEELRLNTDALKLQQQELKNQVAETAILAANSERQAAAAEQMVSATLEDKRRAALKELADALPIFRSVGGTQTGARLRTTIRNAGATISELSAISENKGVTVEIVPKAVFESGTEGKLKIEGATAFPLAFTISFTDRLGRKHTKRYEMSLPHQLHETPAV
jgi:hypothetical protein